jgi:hypothetical protein
MQRTSCRLGLSTTLADSRFAKRLALAFIVRLAREHETVEE